MSTQRSSRPASAALLALACFVPLGCVGPKGNHTRDDRATIDRRGALALLDRADEALARSPALAAELAERATALDPTCGRCHNSLGVARLAQGELAIAADAFATAASLSPTSVEPLVNLGLVHERAGDALAALRCYERAVEAGPSSPIAAGALSRLRARHEHAPHEPDLIELQRLVAMSHPDAAWRAWASDWLAQHAPAFALPAGRASSTP